MVISGLSVDRVTETILRCLSSEGDVDAVNEALDYEVKDIVLRLAPKAADLPLEQLRCALRYWKSLPQVDGVAEGLKVDPTALRGAIGYLMLVDIGDQPDDFRYALYGSKIAAVSGFDMTGKTVWDVGTISAVKVFFAACYRAARELRRPVYSVHKAPPQITASHWHRLILPLGEKGEVKRFLVCNTPVQEGSVV